MSDIISYRTISWRIRRCQGIHIKKVPETDQTVGISSGEISWEPKPPEMFGMELVGILNGYKSYFERYDKLFQGVILYILYKT